MKKLQDEDIQLLSRLIRLSYLRRQHLADAERLARQLEELREKCYPELRRTADRLTLVYSTGAKRIARCSAR